MRSHCLLLICAVLLTTLPVSGWSGIPQLINYQGILTDAAGDPVTTPVNVVFALWNHATVGDSLWSEWQPVTPDTLGRFNVLLGSWWPIPDSVFAGTDVYLSVKVGDDPEMTPRQRIVSAAYAYRVSTVDSASGGTITSKVAIGPDSDNSGLEAFAAGASNTASGHYSVVLGYNNSATDWCGAVGGGTANAATGSYAAIGGGSLNTAANRASVVSGGESNRTDGEYSTVSGGESNLAEGRHSVVGGGAYNRALGQLSVVCGGGGGFMVPDVDSNTALGDHSAIGGGKRNTTLGEGSVVGGGYENSAGAIYATVAGGAFDSAGNAGATVAGGCNNTAIGIYSSVGGGQFNSARNSYATVGGGRYNEVAAAYATIVGGNADTIAAGADYSYLFGIEGRLTQDSTFMVDMPHIRFGDEATGYEFPAADGGSGQTLVTDGSGQLNWVNGAGLPLIETGNLLVETKKSPPDPPTEVGQATIIFSQDFAVPPAVFVTVVVQDDWTEGVESRTPGDVASAEVSAYTDSCVVTVRAVAGGTLIKGTQVELQYLAIGTGAN